MSDTVLIVQALCGVCIAVCALLGTAAGVYGAVRIAQLAKAQLRTDANVEKIELSCNSMKDALVKSTGDAAFAAGQDDMRKRSDVPRPADYHGE